MPPYYIDAGHKQYLKKKITCISNNFWRETTGLLIGMGIPLPVVDLYKCDDANNIEAG